MPLSAGRAVAFLRRHLGLWILLTLGLPFRLWRCSQESNFWVDEVYTVLITKLPLAGLVHETAADAHPPLYYILQKAWLALARRAGFAEGILLARLPDVALWTLLVALTWFAGRRLLGNVSGALAACALAVNPLADAFYCSMRNYVLVVPAMTACAFIVLAAPARGPRAWRWWGAYLACGSVALWSHYFSGLMLAVLGLAWIVRVLAQGTLRSPLFLAGALSQLAILASFAPWFLSFFGMQFRYLESNGVGWQTRPTLLNLLNVPALWFPLGASHGEDFWNAFNGGASLLGPLALGLPLLLGLVDRWLSPAEDPPWQAWRCLAISLGFVFLTWSLAALGLVRGFHGPRYPVLALPLWILGTCGLAGWLGRRPGTRWRSLLAAAPLFLCAAIGQRDALRTEGHGHLGRVLEPVASYLPPRGGDLYILPGELLPYYRHSLSAWHLLPAREFPADSPASILDLNPWWGVIQPADLLLGTALYSRHMQPGNRYRGFPAGAPSYAVVRIERPDPLYMAPAIRGESPAPKPVGALSQAPAPAQERVDGWSILEATEDLEFYRWGCSRTSRIRFDAPLAPGDYQLHIRMTRRPMPRPQVSMTFRVQDEPDTSTICVGPGTAELALALHLTRRHDLPVLEVTHPQWRPCDFDRTSSDNRPLTFLFAGAWVTR